MPGSAKWPPPPDIESIQQLVAEADIEGFIADGAHPDEYEAEAEMLFAQIEHASTDELTAARLLPIIEVIWTRAFNLPADELAERRAKLHGLAEQIARFFGPDARPQVRGVKA
jgi:hypothetical protein